MDYRSAALQHMFRRAPKNPNSLAYTLSKMPKGWIYIRKDGTYHDTMTDIQRQKHLDYLRDKEFQMHANTFVNRFLQNTRLELEKEGYNEEEIEAYIEELFYEEYPEEEDNSDYWDSEESEED